MGFKTCQEVTTPLISGDEDSSGMENKVEAPGTRRKQIHPDGIFVSQHEIQFFIAMLVLMS